LRPDTTPAALTIGVFDGVHRGHQDLVSRMVVSAGSSHLAPVALTFDPDPETLVHPEQPFRSLSTVAEREGLLRDLGVDHVRLVHFTAEVAAQSALDFLRELRDQCDFRELWVGEDFALGHERAGTVDVLRSLGEQEGFTVTAVPLLQHDGEVISSTWIREALGAGNVELARALLGRAYAISGTVQTGAQRGRQLGFPTANVAPPAGRALPADGVYFVQVQIATSGNDRDGSGLPSGKPSYGVVNLGGRPTFGESERLLETHILDFQGDLYGKTMTVEFIEQLRGVERFGSVDELRKQIELDVEAARQLARD